MENPDPPFPQNQKWEIARFCPFRGFILDLGERSLLFHFILSKIVATRRFSPIEKLTN